MAGSGWLVRTFPMRTLAVLATDSYGKFTREVVIERCEAVVPAGQLLRLSVARILPARGRPRMFDDEAELAVVDSDGNVLANASGQLNRDEVLTLDLQPLPDCERHVIATAKIARTSAPDESRIFGVEEREPRVTAWADLFADRRAGERRGRRATDASSPDTPTLLVKDKPAPPGRGRTGA